MKIQMVSNPSLMIGFKYFYDNNYKSASTSSFTTYTPRALKDSSASIDQIFNRLRDEWMEETQYKNSISDIIENEKLASIIEMGDSVVPLILRDLRDSPKHWFYALRKITKANPIRRKDAGNLDAMRQAWLGWADKNGIQY